MRLNTYCESELPLPLRQPVSYNLARGFNQPLLLPEGCLLHPANFGPTHV